MRKRPRARLRACLFGLLLLASGGALEYPTALAQTTPANTATVPGESIRLSTVLQVAVRQSPRLASARIDSKIAEAQLVQTMGIEDYLLRASGSYFTQSNQAVDGDITGTNSSDSLEASVSLSKLLSTGGTVTLHASSSRQATELAFTGDDIIRNNSRLSATLDQPLLRGRGEALTKAQQTQARHNISATALENQARARDEIQAILNAYWELVFAHKELEIRRSAIELAFERRRLTESSIALGSAAQTALLEVDQVVATSEEDILLAEQRVTLRSLELRRLSGLEIGPQHLDLAPEETLNVNPQHFDMAAVVSDAFAASPELKALSERGKGAQIDVEVTDNGYLPRLDLSLSAGPLGTDDNLGGSLAKLGTFKGYFLSGSLNFEQRLNSRWAEGSQAAARESLRKIQVSEREIKAQISVATTQAVQSAHLAKKRMELSQRAIELSEKNIDAERRRFELGRATNFDVLQRQEEQKQARLRLARAAVDYLKATVAIEAMRGSLLGTYGISLE